MTADTFEIDASQVELSTEEQKATLLLCKRRLLPVCYISALLAYLDRTNLSFAKLCVPPPQLAARQPFG
jgi:hypothetical protein